MHNSGIPFTLIRPQFLKRSQCDDNEENSWPHSLELHQRAEWYYWVFIYKCSVQPCWALCSWKVSVIVYLPKVKAPQLLKWFCTCGFYLPYHQTARELWPLEHCPSSFGTAPMCLVQSRWAWNHQRRTCFKSPHLNGDRLLMLLPSLNSLTTVRSSYVSRRFFIVFFIYLKTPTHSSLSFILVIWWVIWKELFVLFQLF